MKTANEKNKVFDFTFLSIVKSILSSQKNQLKSLCTIMNKFIAYIDILGFKELVLNNDHETLIKKFQNLFSISIELSLSQGKYNIIENSGKELAVPDLNHALVNSINISDSVILWTDDDSMQSFINLIVTVRNVINHCTLAGFPMRGAIVRGEMTFLKRQMGIKTDVTQQALIGKGIVDAYIQESKQEWAGCTVDATAIKAYIKQYEEMKNKVKYLPSIEYLVEKKLICKYKVPYKTGIIKDEYVLEWPAVNRTLPDEKRIRDAFSMHNKNTNDLSVELKILNTLRFIAREQ